MLLKMPRPSTKLPSYSQVLNWLQNTSKPHHERFLASLPILENEARTNGFDDSDMNILVNICTNVIEKKPWKCLLIKCLVPVKQISEDAFDSIICLFFSPNIGETVSVAILQWMIGLLQYELINKELINAYYDVFFHLMLKNKKLEKLLSQLIYILAEPQDAMRRDVDRLLTISKTHKKPLKHITGLLSLFKTYKPESVPESIPTINLQTIWSPIPTTLRNRFEEAQKRCRDENKNLNDKMFHWNSDETVKRGKYSPPLIPSVSYFHMGSSAFKDEDLIPLSNITSTEDLAKHYSNIALPDQAVSLLSNEAGYHLLTFADFQYQTRFSYNLYNTFTTVFKMENNFPPEEIRKLLVITKDFCDYMQQDIPVVNRFLNEYCLFNHTGYDQQFLDLFSWMITVPLSELQNQTFVYLKTIFPESSLEMKCKIIKTMKNLIINLFVDGETEQMSPFLNRVPVNDFKQVYPILTKFTEDLIIIGFTIHSYNPTLLDEVLLFYEQISSLELTSRVFFTCTLPPRMVIHCGLITRSSATLYRVCKLLLNYRQLLLNNQDLNETLSQLSIYVADVLETLWNTKNRGDEYFLKDFSKSITEEYEDWDFESLLSIDQHCCMLPFAITMSEAGITKGDEISRMAVKYYPSIAEFFDKFSD